MGESEETDTQPCWVSHLFHAAGLEGGAPEVAPGESWPGGFMGSIEIGPLPGAVGSFPGPALGSGTIASVP